MKEQLEILKAKPHCGEYWRCVLALSAAWGGPRLCLFELVSLFSFSFFVVSRKLVVQTAKGQESGCLQQVLCLPLQKCFVGHLDRGDFLKMSSYVVRFWAGVCMECLGRRQETGRSAKSGRQLAWSP